MTETLRSRQNSLRILARSTLLGRSSYLGLRFRNSKPTARVKAKQETVLSYIFIENSQTLEIQSKKRDCKGSIYRDCDKAAEQLRCGGASVSILQMFKLLYTTSRISNLITINIDGTRPQTQTAQVDSNLHIASSSTLFMQS